MDDENFDINIEDALRDEDEEAKSFWEEPRKKKKKNGMLRTKKGVY
jgi:hypothetical protein